MAIARRAAARIRLGVRVGRIKDERKYGVLQGLTNGDRIGHGGNVTVRGRGGFGGCSGGSCSCSCSSSCCVGARLTATGDRLREVGQHRADAIDESSGGGAVGGAEQSGANGYFQVGVEFHQRAACDGDVADEFLRVETAGALGDVRGDRSCASPDLADRPERSDAGSLPRARTRTSSAPPRTATPRDRGARGSGLLHGRMIAEPSSDLHHPISRDHSASAIAEHRPSTNSSTNTSTAPYSFTMISFRCMTASMA